MNNGCRLIGVAASCALLINPPNLGAQQIPVNELKVYDEAVNLKRYPLHLDPDMGIGTVRLGKDRLHQMDLSLVEIPPGGKTPPDRHLAEEMIYIVAGKGYTTMWVKPGEPPQRYEWSAGDLLSPSLNAWHQHYNASADAPARYLSLTTMPLSLNVFQDREFLFSSSHVFEVRWWHGVTQQPVYKVPGISEGRDNIDMVAGHLLPNLPGRKMKNRRKAVLGITTRPAGDFAGNHILELGVREYQDSSRHPSIYPRETIVYILEGEGTTILKHGAEPARRVDWGQGDLFIIEANEDFDNGARPGIMPEPPYPRILMIKPAGYFIGVGNIVPGSNQYSN